MSDLISRKAAIDAICESANDLQNVLIPVYYRELIGNLPTVQPEPQEGYWILRETYYGDEQYECSQCGVIWEFADGTPKENDSYYCPHCGARMKGVKHEED